MTAARDLQRAGAEVVLVTRAEEPALVAIGEQMCEMVVPNLEPAEPRGAGDSLTAGVVAGLAWGLDLAGALRLGGAAGAANVVRHGLGTGSRHAVELLAGRVQLRPWEVGT